MISDMGNPVSVHARSCWLFLSRSFTSVELVQQSDQSGGKVCSQSFDHKQPHSCKPAEGGEVYNSIDDARKDVEHAEAEGGNEEVHFLLVQGVEDASKAGDVDDTPDDCPDHIAQIKIQIKIRMVFETDAQYVDDPDGNQADACIPETNKVKS